ncbi:MAG TPA: hypothetical protein VFQ06_11300 [Nitrospira sp.]|nr:hypothetical protein [Nitrospira sp.]
MALVEIRQGGALAPPYDATFWVTYDDVTERIASMRCVNNHPTLGCRMVFRNSLTGQSLTRIVPPATTESHTFNQSQNFTMNDDAWGYSMSMVQV